MKVNAHVAIITIVSMLFALQAPALAATQDAAARGTVFTVRFTEPIGSDISQPGDPVYAVLDEPLISGGRVIFPAGSRVTGEVNSVTPARGGQSNGAIDFVFNRIIHPNGTEASIVANLEGYSEYHESSWRKRALTVAIAIGAGAVISKIFGGSIMRGVLIGGAAGTGYVLYAEGEDIRIEEGATVNLVLEESVTVRFDTGDQASSTSTYTSSDSAEPVANPAFGDQPANSEPSGSEVPYGEVPGETASGQITNGPSATIIFTDGNTSNGTFSGVTSDGKVLLNQEYGQMSIPVNKINEIIFTESVDARESDDSDTVVLYNGNILTGFFGGFSSGEVVLNTDYGELRVPLRDIARIKFMVK